MTSEGGGGSAETDRKAAVPMGFAEKLVRDDRPRCRWVTWVGTPQQTKYSAKIDKYLDRGFLGSSHIVVLCRMPGSWTHRDWLNSLDKETWIG